MKTIVKQSTFSDGGPNGTERNACALFALDAITKWGYAKCAELARVRAGRKPGQGTKIFDLLGKGDEPLPRVIDGYSFQYLPPTCFVLRGGRRVTTARAARRLRTGNYLLVVNSGRGAHAIALKWGVVYDNLAGGHPRARVLCGWEVRKNS